MRGFLAHRFRRTTLVAGFCASLLGGIGLAHRYQAGIIVMAGCLIACLFFGWRKTWLGLFAVILFGLAIGSWRGGIYVHRQALYTPLYGRKVTIVGRASEDAVYAKQTQLAFDLVSIQRADGKPLPGKLGIKGFGANAAFKGDVVTVTGKLYPGIGSYQGFISFAQLGVRPQPSTFVDNLRRKFNAGMQSALPEPAASFGMGLLIGQRNTLPDDVTNNLKHVGLTHIIAVSGYNLTIILLASRRLLGKRSKYQFAVLSLLLIGGFLLLTGSSPSIIRAAIVSVLSLAAWYYGRTFRPPVLILLAAAITGYMNPIYVWSDAGWYLSFLAFFGVMIIAPLISGRFVSSERLRSSIIFSVALESFCAELMTIPYVLHTFGQMSLIGLVANVLVTALVPLAMLLALVAGLAGMFMPMIAGWLAWPALVLLTYMLDVSSLLARVPHIFIDNRTLSIRALLMAYAIVFVFIAVVGFKSKGKHAIITDENNENERDALNVRTQQMVNN